MNIVTIPLADALGIERDEGQDAPSSLLTSALSKCVNGFACERSSYHAEFLRETAPKHHDEDISKTYLMVNSDVLADVVSGNPNADTSKLVIAYFTIGLSSIVLSKHGIGKNKQDRLRGRMFRRDEAIGCFVIGSLCRSDEYTRDQVPGSLVLKECLAIIKDVQKMIGGTLILVESRRSVFRSIYEKAGFEEIYVSKNTASDGAEMIVSGLSIAKPKSK